MALCPHCENEVSLGGKTPRDKENQVIREEKGVFKEEIMYACPHCFRVLGFGLLFLG